VAFILSPIEDHNALTMHLLDVILTHQKATLGPAKGVNGAPAGIKSSQGQKAEGEQYSNGNGYSAAAAGGQQQQQQQSNAGGSIREQVLHAFQHGPGADSDSGCSTDGVAKQLPHLTFGQVSEAVTQLSNEGHLYSTVDEEHYKTTAA
jgi:replication factor A2